MLNDALCCLPLPDTAAPYRRRLPDSLWRRAGLEPPPQAPLPPHLEQLEQGKRPTGWPLAMRINSEEVCGEDHPTV